MSVVKAFKLVTGEEIIAEVRDSTTQLLLEEVSKGMRAEEKSYVLRRPNVLHFQQVAPGKFGMAMAPYTLSNPELEEVTIPANKIITTYNVASSVEKQYLEQNTGLALSGDIGASQLTKFQ